LAAYGADLDFTSAVNSPLSTPPLLGNGANQLAVYNETGRRIRMEGVEAENRYHALTGI
jgi:hypothetical protein